MSRVRLLLLTFYLLVAPAMAATFAVFLEGDMATGDRPDVMINKAIAEHAPHELISFQQTIQAPTRQPTNCNACGVFSPNLYVTLLFKNATRDELATFALVGLT